MAEELYLEVDENNKEVGYITADELLQRGAWHRSVMLLLFNTRNEMLLQKRSKNMQWYPGTLTFAVGGTIENESALTCIERETKEEIGIEVEPQEIFQMKFTYGTDRAFATVFRAVTDNKPYAADKIEVEDVVWISLTDLKKELAMHPEKFSPPFVDAMKIYFANNY